MKSYRLQKAGKAVCQPCKVLVTKIGPLLPVLQVMQIYQMDAMNFQFISHPNAWVVHRPHAPSSGYNHTFTGAHTIQHL